MNLMYELQSVKCRAKFQTSHRDVDGREVANFTED